MFGSGAAQSAGRRARVARAVAAVLVAAVLVACDRGGDGDGASAPFETPQNGVEVEMFDFGYRLEGAATAGPVTFSTVNTGREWHMATFGKLHAGKTVGDVVTFLDAQTAGDQVEGIDTLIERGLGSPGHILQPGHRQSITVDTVDAGSYVMICYLPVEGQGTPHFTKGMVAGFEVGPPAAVTAPQTADFDVVLGDSAEPTGLPTQLEPGLHTLKLTSTGGSGKDFTISQLGDGQTLGSFAIYFAAEFPKAGGPDAGMVDRAPGRVLGSSFQIEAGHSVWLTVDLPPGETYFDSATNVPGGNPVHKIVTATVA